MMNRALAHNHRIERNHAMDNDERYGADMTEAVADVLTNVFGDRFEDDDEQLAVKALCERYTEHGYRASRIREYAASEHPGYYDPRVDSETWDAVIRAGLVNP